MLEDRLLIWKLNRGNRDVLRRIYEKYKDDLVTLAAALLNDKTGAEYAVHDAFVSFIKSAEKFRLTVSLKGYLATCVANNTRNINKARGRHQYTALDTAGAISSDSNRPECTAMFGEDLHQLSQPKQKVLQRNVAQGLTLNTQKTVNVFSWPLSW